MIYTSYDKRVGRRPAAALCLTLLMPCSWFILSAMACIWPGDDYFLLMIGGMPATLLVRDYAAGWAATIVVLGFAGWLGDLLRASAVLWWASVAVACALQLGLLALFPVGREVELRQIGSWLALGRIGCCTGAAITIAAALAISYTRLLKTEWTRDRGARE